MNVSEFMGAQDIGRPGIVRFRATKNLTRIGPGTALWPLFGHPEACHGGGLSILSIVRFGFFVAGFSEICTVPGAGMVSGGC